MQDVSLEEGLKNAEGKQKRRRGKYESENQQQTQQPSEPLRFEARLFWGEACAVSYTCTSPHPMEGAMLIVSQTILWVLMTKKEYFRCICCLTLA